MQELMMICLYSNYDFEYLDVMSPIGKVTKFHRIASKKKDKKFCFLEWLGINDVNVLSSNVFYFYFILHRKKNLCLNLSRTVEFTSVRLEMGPERLEAGMQPSKWQVRGIAINLCICV